MIKEHKKTVISGTLFNHVLYNHEYNLQQFASYRPKKNGFPRQKRKHNFQ